MGFSSFSSWWGGELQIYDDRTLIRFFSGRGKLRMFKRGNKEILQCSLLRVKYIGSFFLFCFSSYILASGLFFVVFVQNSCILTCGLFCLQQYKYLTVITTESMLIP